LMKCLVHILPGTQYSFQFFFLPGKFRDSTLVRRLLISSKYIWILYSQVIPHWALVIWILC
jgi:hypothetical protein